LVWIDRGVVARISYVLVSHSSVLHATISRVWVKEGGYGGNLRPCTYVYGYRKLCQNSKR